MSDGTLREVSRLLEPLARCEVVDGMVVLAFEGGDPAPFLRAMAGAAVFRWTKSNSHFQAGSGEFIAIGGGSHFALWLDEELHFGSSGPCETFGSPCLAGRGLCAASLGQATAWGWRPRTEGICAR